VAANKNQGREAREARERLRLYTARRDVNAHQVTRRKRDNIIAVLGALVVIVLAATTQVLYFTAGPGTPEPAPSASASADPQGENVGDVPDPALAEGRSWSGELVLNDIPLGITLDGAAAPQAVASLVNDITSGYLVGKACHRLVDSEGFRVLQCGALDASGAADEGYSFGPIENAPADDAYPTATIAMARVGGDAYSNGHQFFIVFGDTSIPADEAGGYSVVGTVTSGLDALQAGIVSGGIADGATDGPPVVPTTITAATIQ
jgi:peptidyl-prolyl cis-trans isomerase B (cyclophilin B)